MGGRAGEHPDESAHRPGGKPHDLSPAPERDGHELGEDADRPKESEVSSRLSTIPFFFAHPVLQIHEILFYENLAISEVLTDAPGDKARS